MSTSVVAVLEHGSPSLVYAHNDDTSQSVLLLDVCVPNEFQLQRVYLRFTVLVGRRFHCIGAFQVCPSSRALAERYLSPVHYPQVRALAAVTRRELHVDTVHHLQLTLRFTDDAVNAHRHLCAHLNPKTRLYVNLVTLYGPVNREEQEHYQKEND